MARKMILMLSVVALADSRWRAGLQFTREARSIPIDDLDADQIAAIETDPLLSSQRVKEEVGDDAADAKAVAEAAAAAEAQAAADAKAKADADAKAEADAKAAAAANAK